MVLGYMFVAKSEWFLSNLGRVGWAEDHMAGSGGTRMFYKLLGIVIILFGILMMTGMLGGLLIDTVGRLFVPPGTTLPQQ